MIGYIPQKLEESMSQRSSHCKHPFPPSGLPDPEAPSRRIRWMLALRKASSSSSRKAHFRFATGVLLRSRPGMGSV